MNKRKSGEYWETFAAKHLLRKKYKIMDRNWTCHWAEIDIVAKHKDTIVFIEVKYRNSKMGMPHEAVNYYKRKAQYRAIQLYLLQNNLQDKFWRFDVFSISKESEKVLIDHFEAVPVHL